MKDFMINFRVGNTIDSVTITANDARQAKEIFKLEYPGRIIISIIFWDMAE